jgi:dipeptidyl aminopeptidase/acylaminoacyl peptidase
MKNSLLKTIFMFTLLNGQINISLAQTEQKFELPPPEIMQLADVKPRPMVLVDDKADYMVLMQRNSMYKSLVELSEKEFRLAGLRINPQTFGPSRANYTNSVSIKNIKAGNFVKVSGFPADALLGNFVYSPDQSKLACYNNTGKSLELWIINVKEAKAQKIAGIPLNAVIGNTIDWLSNDHLLVKEVASNGLSLIENEPVPDGPIVQESKGAPAPNRTYQDLLKNTVDEDNLSYFGTVNLVKVDLSGKKDVLLSNILLTSYEVSPDRQMVIVEQVIKPFSYTVPYYRFPSNISVFNLDGTKAYNVADIPLTEEMPIGNDAVRKGIRNVRWRPDVPATLFWVEALDKGDPSTKVLYRDAIYSLAAPFTGKKNEVIKTANRLRSSVWGENSIAIFTDYRWKDRNSKTYLLDFSQSVSFSSVLFDRNSEDLYADPGNFIVKRNQYGFNSLLFSKDKKKLYLKGEGCSPKGNRPFIDELNLQTGNLRKRLWIADGKSTYEKIIDVVDIEKGILLTSIESVSENPNYYLRNFKIKKEPVKITDFPHPYASFKDVYKERIRYKRDDGVNLGATLYLPAGYDRRSGEKLPMIMWAYPKEFKSAAAAGQVSVSPHEFTYLSYGSPVYWAAMGYAILDDVDFPIIGEGVKEPNDTYIKQLVANAKAAIDAVDALGYIDPKKVAVGGHSYGAFMTANLLTHSNLFACGLARSGAYNRTLTPFGFQSEERTFWQAPEVYSEMSPFNHADKIKTPILLIHGNADNNPGTFTLQSERYFQALKGHGAVARLVLLPFESHGYASRENIMHVLWEQDQWFQKYLKD